jgi:hypothetical protein
MMMMMMMMMMMIIIIIIMSGLGVLDVVGAERRFSILNRDRLQHRCMCFKLKKLLILPMHYIRVFT